MTINGAQFVTTVLIRPMLKRLVTHWVLVVVHILLQIQDFPSPRFRFGWMRLTVTPTTGYEYGGSTTAAVDLAVTTASSRQQHPATPAARSPARQTFWNVITVVGA